MMDPMTAEVPEQEIQRWEGEGGFVPPEHDAVQTEADPDGGA